MKGNHVNRDISAAILKTLNYFHIFRHPLYAEEIHRFSGETATLQQVHAALDEMCLCERVYKHDNMYMLENNSQLAQKRAGGKQMADKLIVKAERSARIISQFPFVRAVCISGSLSKGYADERSDIDLFIITAKNRLWTSRTILHFYKKLTFLFGKQHSFCMNYFLDESHPLLEENNIFTATELTTLLPVYGKVQYTGFIGVNNVWLSKQFPNILSFHQPGLLSEQEKNSFIKLATEAVLNIMLPGMLNRFFLKFTDTWWRYKWRKKNYPMQDYDLAMKTKIYVSKNHPANYQKKVLKNVNEVAINPQLQVG